MDVHLTVSNYRCFSDRQPASLVIGDGLTAIVGANNSGKSALLRFFWELRPLFAELAGPPPRLQQALAGNVGFNASISDLDQLFYDGGTGDLVVVIELPDRAASPGGEPVANRFTLTIPRGTNTYSLAIGVLGKPIISVHHWVDQYPLDEQGRRLADPDDLLHAIRGLARMRLIGPRRAASTQATSYDFDGVTGSNLVNRWKSLKGGGRRGRDAAAEIERRLGALFNLDRLAITFSENGMDLFVSVGNQSYHIDELGSGLSHFLVVLVTLEQYRDTSWVLIDEPDNGLHPTMQMEFLRTAATDVSEGVIFATHNYGLAKQSAARTYFVDRPTGATSSRITTPVQLESLSEFLGELGYSGYRDQGVERLLLLEGTHDVRVVDEFRRILRMPSNVLLLPLAGTNGINMTADSQLAELLRICPKVFAMIDSERTASKSTLSEVRRSFRDSCRKLGITCHILRRRSMENYLSDRAIKLVLGSNAQALGPFQETSRDLKANQAKVAALMTAAEITDTDVGRFLSVVFAQT
jgi:hypothetical protein